MKKHGECFKLNNGVEIPCIGYGTYKAAEGKSSSIIRMAIDAGYRYFDTAAYYGTEEYLGEAIAESGLPREQFFITSKVLLTVTFSLSPFFSAITSISAIFTSSTFSAIIVFSFASVALFNNPVISC